jgi:phospholipid/cholesterol/gamma-HCH transport system substrate-binding protein
MAAEANIAPKGYDERIYRKGHPPHRMRTAVIALILLLAGSYLAWTKELPFKSEYELKAVFANAANIRKDSPVRIAGVNVGEVVGVEGKGENAEVTFTVTNDGRPIHEDAEVQIRPRIFLEGNFFLDVRPGSPSAEELDSGDVIPLTHTSTAVQLDEVLTALQAPDRENLVRLLEGFGTALNHVPTAAEDRGQDPDVQGESAAQAINDSFKYAGPAGRDSAIVAEALQGTEPHDLSRMLRSQADVFAALLVSEGQLQDLLTNFNTFSGALAAESENLGETVRELAPTLEIAKPSLANLNASFPALRAFARDIKPGIEELPATIAASGPWLRQTYRLLGKRELKYVARQLRLSGPPLGKTGAVGPSLFGQLGLFARCANDTLIPTGNAVVPNNGTDAFSTGSPNYQEFLYAAVNFAGISQNFDGNGPFLRVQGGGSVIPNVTTLRADNPGQGTTNPLWGYSSPAPAGDPVGTRPSLAASPRPPFRTNVACHTSAIPNFTSSVNAPGPASPDYTPFPP